MSASSEEAYRLSHEIVGHSADVRVVRYCPVAAGISLNSHVLLTASRDGTACVWEPEGAPSRSYILKKVVRKHAGYVSALCVIPEDKTAGREESELFYVKHTTTPNNAHFGFSACAQALHMHQEESGMQF